MAEEPIQLIPELRLGPISDQRGMEVAMMDILSTVNQLVRTVNQLIETRN